MNEHATEAITYIPILPDREAMLPYLEDEFCTMVFELYERFYEKHSYMPPWTGYFALRDGAVVGVGGFKGTPNHGKVEIGYGTVPACEGQGISSATCAFLTKLALDESPGVRVTARTLREMNSSTSILRKNGFTLLGDVEDPEDGLVWEWEYGKDEQRSSNIE
jgi:RimJ/RimL family protein N-acetyltransferase